MSHRREGGGGARGQCRRGRLRTFIFAACFRSRHFTHLHGCKAPNTPRCQIASTIRCSTVVCAIQFAKHIFQMLSHARNDLFLLRLLSLTCVLAHVALRSLKIVLLALSTHLYEEATSLVASVLEPTWSSSLKFSTAACLSVFSP